MADIVPINGDIPANQETPGVYFQIQAGGSSSALDDAANRVMLWGHKLSGGTAAQNAPIRTPSLSQAIAYAGRGSDLVRAYQAYQSQAGSGAADVYMMPVPEPSGGTQATRLIKFIGTPTTAGSVDVIVCGYLHSVRITTDDTATSIGGAVAAALTANLDLPCTAGASTGTITLTYRHKGLVGNDLPITVNLVGASGITVSPGNIVYATNAGADGTALVSVGGTSYSATVTTADTPTVIGDAVAAVINAAAGPVTAINTAGDVRLYFVADRVVNKVRASLVTVTGTTVAVNCGTVAVDTGTERPVLTAAIAALAAMAGGARLHLNPWANTTTMGTLSAHIELYQNGRYQRDQYLFTGTNDGIVTAGALTSPLNNLWRYLVAVCPDSPQQGMEEAARIVGLIAAEAYVPKNQDGAAIHSDSVVPLMLPHPSVRIAPQSDDSQMALHTYGLCPIGVTAGGSKVVIKLRSTSTIPITSGGIPDMPVGLHLGFLRVQFVDAASACVAGKSIRRNGTPRSANTITITQIKSACVARAVDLDELDLFDGAGKWAASFAFAFDGTDPTKVNGYLPLAVIYPLHITGLVGSPVI